MLNLYHFHLAALLLYFSHARIASGNSIESIEHIVIFMQENRPFDHYFGMMKGVRGFNDRTALPLKNGFNAFYQPISSDSGEYMLPFRVDKNKTNAMCMPAPEMWYPTDIKIWNGGRMDSWNTARDPGYGMSYFTREDLPFYYTLYDNFVSGDQYFQSTFTCTNPNRMLLFTGSNGLSVGEDPVLDNTEPMKGYDWITLAEILETANVSWKVYQQLDNFDDNAFAWFSNFRSSRPGDPLFEKGMKRQLNAIEAFGEDLATGTLPQVSWIIAPTEKSEHATNHPAAGEDWTAQLLSKLAANPDIYAKTAFILNYDEGGQFFDHAWTPTPPLSANDGISTVSVDGEVNTNVMTDGGVPAPIGLGFRVPLLIVSPWTRGNIVVSEVFDHTSVIRLIEKRFNVHCPNISPWRRAVVGDLLSAFDFENPDYSWPSNLPDTSDYVRESDVECNSLPDPTIPAEQFMPIQEPGTKISRALPYEFIVSDLLTKELDGSTVLVVTLTNSGAAGGAFVLLDVLNLSAAAPRLYTVEAGRQITDRIAIPSSYQSYHYHIQGPNGFVREFSGDVSINAVQVSSGCLGANAALEYSPKTSELAITMAHGEGAHSTSSLKFSLLDNVYNLLEKPVAFDIEVGKQQSFSIDVSSSGYWYDITVTASVSDDGELSSECFRRRFLGRMETGRDSISDPAMASGVAAGLWRTDTIHKLLPEKLRTVKRIESTQNRVDKDAVFRWREVPVV